MTDETDETDEQLVPAAGGSAVPGDVDGDGLSDVPAVGGDLEEEDALVAFWQAAQAHLGLGRMDVVMGPGDRDLVAPPVWSFGDSPQLADELLELVLAGRKTATAGALGDYEAAGEALPQVGDVSIVTDGSGAPRVVLRATQVDVVPFDEVGAEHAALEGEGDRSLEQWRRDHEAVWRRRLPAEPFDPRMPMVLERFEVVYPTLGPTPAE
ncbi:hypothetical protein CELL_03437 [Cellulomonas sp. T2.31MG-18]|uniref:ASCH domain-containing protein n=1 Tax=Cellulomonas sp. T2.31MG-18 TaxID=3157619 RepID=UPI0035EF9E60